MAIRPNVLIPAGGVAIVDRLLGRLRPDSCAIQRRSGGRSPGGAPTATFATVATVPCAVVVPGRTPGEGVAGGRFGPAADYEVRVPRDADVRSEDRIAVNGQTLEVTYAPTAASEGFELIVLAKAGS